jgi:hypothetical protein
VQQSLAAPESGMKYFKVLVELICNQQIVLHQSPISKLARLLKVTKATRSFPLRIKSFPHEIEVCHSCARPSPTSMSTPVMYEPPSRTRNHPSLYIVRPRWLGVTTSIQLGHRNGGGEHTVPIETTLQPSQPSSVAAVGIPDVLNRAVLAIRIAAG